MPATLEISVLKLKLINDGTGRGQSPRAPKKPRADSNTIQKMGQHRQVTVELLNVRSRK